MATRLVEPRFGCATGQGGWRVEGGVEAVTFWVS